MMKKNSGFVVSAVLIAVNFLLFAVKLYVGLAVSSLSIYTDAMNNLIDCFVGMIAVFGFFILAKNRNKKYPFGFGRAEDIVSFVMSAVVCIAGFAFAYSSVERILYPTPVAYSMKYVYIIVITGLVKLGLAVYIKIQTAKNPSDVLKSMYFDSLLDFFITLSVVLSFTVSVYTGIVTDGIAGLVISILITVNGIKLMIPSLRKLMGSRNDVLCKEAAEFLGGLNSNIEIDSVECHSYGNKNVFNAVVSVKDKNNIVDFSDVAGVFEKNFSSEIYFKII